MGTNFSENLRLTRLFSRFACCYNWGSLVRFLPHLSEIGPSRILPLLHGPFLFLDIPCLANCEFVEPTTWWLVDVVRKVLWRARFNFYNSCLAIQKRALTSYFSNLRHRFLGSCPSCKTVFVHAAVRCFASPRGWVVWRVGLRSRRMSLLSMN
jgi:hypothetical protein